jgi:excisionase family DNA binding protein
LPPDRTSDQSRQGRPAATGAPPSTFTVAEAAQQLGVGTATVLAWINSGELKAVNMARSAKGRRPRWRITRAALDAFLLTRTTTQAPAKSSRRTRAKGDVIPFY